MKRPAKTLLPLFRASESHPIASADSGVKYPKRMDLEGRQAYRKKMLTQSIHETFTSMAVGVSQYTIAVVPVDARHHRFAVMIDVARSFLTVNAARTMSFSEIEVLMRTNTYNRFGILSVATYWRVGESDAQVEHSTRSEDASDASCNPMLPLVEPQAEHIRTVSMQAPTLAPDVQQALTDDRTENLEGGIMIGGTQYGRL